MLDNTGGLSLHLHAIKPLTYETSYYPPHLYVILTLIFFELSGFALNAQIITNGCTPTDNFIQKWHYNNISSDMEDCQSQIYDDGTDIGIGTVNPQARLHLIAPSNYTATPLFLLSDNNDNVYMQLARDYDPVNTSEIGSALIVPTTPNIPGLLVTTPDLSTYPFAAYGNGTVNIGSFNSLDLSNCYGLVNINKTEDNYPFVMDVTSTFATTSSRVFSIRNEGYVGIGHSNNSNGNGNGSAMLHIADKKNYPPDHTLLISNYHETGTYFMVNPTGAGVGTKNIGDATFRIKALDLEEEGKDTKLDIAANHEGEYATQIRFLGYDGNIRHIIRDDIANNELVIDAGWNGNTANLAIDSKVRIGKVEIPPNAAFNLFVERGIMTERVKVAVHGTNDWSDFVFDKNYKLATLKELERYIKENKHLPGVPSAAEVVTNGIDLAKMDATLLQKIEELTLYVLELKRETENQKALIDSITAGKRTTKTIRNASK